MAIPTPVSVKGEDGTEFKVRLMGDEFLSWYEDTTGNVMVKDDAGVMRYSEFKTDHFEKGDSLSKTSRRRHLTRSDTDLATRRDIAEYGRRRRRERGYPTPSELHRKRRERKSRTDKSDQNILVTKARMSQVKPVASDPQPADASYAPPAGSIPFPILLVFVKFADSSSFPETELTDTEIEELFFGPRFSVASWYKTNTAGAVNVTKAANIVRLTLPGALQNFDKNSALTQAQLETPALNALVSSGFDFTPYETTDSTGAKVVAPEDLCVALLVHSYDSSGGHAPGVWGHAYIGDIGWDTPNGASLLSLQTYGTYSAPGQKLPIGLAIHEGAHARFSLPDLYPTDGSHLGLGMWSVMASGSWGASPYAHGKNVGDCPTCFDPLSLMLIDDDLVCETITTPTTPGTYKTYFGNDNSVNFSLIETQNPNEFFAIQWRGFTLILDGPDSEMTMEMYDAGLVEWWKLNGAVTSYLDPYINDDDGSTVYRATLSCNVIYHIDLSQTDNIVVGSMLEQLIEMHGGVQNLLQLRGSANSNYTDPKDPATLASSYIVLVPTTTDSLAGPVDKAYDPPLKMNDGSDLALKLTDFVNTLSGVDSSYTVILSDTPDDPVYGDCYICDRPKVYQIKTW